MQTQFRGGQSVEICYGCGGLWCSRERFGRAIEAAKKRGRVPLQPSKILDDGPLPCAECRQTMARKNYGETSGVMIDACATHGIFLDAGELERIRRFLQGENPDPPSRPEGVAEPPDVEARTRVAGGRKHAPSDFDNHDAFFVADLILGVLFF